MRENVNPNNMSKKCLVGVCERCIRFHSDWM